MRELASEIPEDPSSSVNPANAFPLINNSATISTFLPSHLDSTSE
jgi:hypothetical protein